MWLSILVFILLVFLCFFFHVYCVVSIKFDLVQNGETLVWCCGCGCAVAIILLCNSLSLVVQLSVFNCLDICHLGV